MRALIVDDSKFMRNIIIDILNKHNINVIGEASSGKEAVSSYLKLKPDVVTMDLTMTEMSGIEAINEILRIDPKAYIIACSAMGQKAIVKEAIDAGAKGFIVKPFEEEDLMKEINKFKK
jgi:two-component system chemotaxis response regulator CheY